MTLVPLKRTLHLANPEMRGPDVASLQQLLNQHGAALVVDGVYGIHTAEEVQDAKQRLQMVPVNQLAGPLFWKRLKSEKVPPKPADPHAAIRAAGVEEARWMIAHHAPNGINYGELRPRQGRKRRVVPFTTDCSGSSTDIYEWVAELLGIPVPNPNGGPFGASAYTGLVLQHCRPIIKTQALPLDLVVFGNYPGVHMGVLLEAGTAPDPELFNHGRQGQPVSTTVSAEISLHPTSTVHYVTALA